MSGSKLPTMTDRDAAICRAYEFGYCGADIGRAFGLSGTRVGQILKKHEVRPRSPCILALVWDGEPMEPSMPDRDPNIVTSGLSRTVTVDGVTSHCLAHRVRTVAANP